jgi:glycerol-3-phosphate dehydrogenase
MIDVADPLEVGRDGPQLPGGRGDGCDVTSAEVLYSVRDEMAVHLSDVVLRRTEAGSAACPDRAALERIAGVMAGECGWSAERTSAEIASVENSYRLPG